MCRATFEGGRRCPSHTNPVLIAAYNAKRRERYAARKQLSSPQETLQPETTHLGALVEPAVPVSELVHPLFSKGFFGKTGGELYTTTPGANELTELNISVTKTGGELVDNGYFADQITQGVINYSNLNEKSYTLFGFGEVDHKGFYRDRKFTAAVIEDLSGLELSEVTPEEERALNYFTGESYEWINKTLYDGAEPPEEGEEDDGEEAFAGDNFYPTQNWKTLDRTVSLIDSAMKKAPKKQRIVYRGMSPSNPLFVEMSGGSINDPHVIGKWVDDNLTLGQEIKFDGYQSATPEYRSAAEYAGYDGSLVYEILTSEGINVCSISEYPTEREVLLPREARYMVVGVHKDVQGYRGNTHHVVQLVAINEKGAVLDGANSDEPEPVLHF